MGAMDKEKAITVTGKYIPPHRRQIDAVTFFGTKTKSTAANSLVTKPKEKTHYITAASTASIQPTVQSESSVRIAYKADNKLGHASFTQRDTFVVQNVNVHYGENSQEAPALAASDFIAAVKRCYEEEHYQLLSEFHNSMPIKDCYVNLAIMHEKEQHDKEKQLKEQFEKEGFEKQKGKNYDQRLSSYERIYGGKQPIALEDLFKSDTSEKQEAPKKLLVLGRARIGKSTLCQYIAYQWASGRLWQDQSFRVVLWIPLRKLLNYSDVECTIENVIYNECLAEGDKAFGKLEVATLREPLRLLQEKQYILYILDGYDEVASVNQDTPQGKLISQLLKKSQIILTSRPYFMDDDLKGKGLVMDRRLENIGFTTENIATYIRLFFQQAQQPALAESLVQYLKTHPNIQGIVHIPINLALMCVAWKNHYHEGQALPETFTVSELYQSLVTDRVLQYLSKYHSFKMREEDYSDIKSYRLFKAIENGNREEVEVLIAQGVDIESRNGYHNTPLYEATYNNQVDIVKLLLERGANLSAECHESREPLLIATIQNHISIAELLLAKGANTECRDLVMETPLHIACDFNFTPLISLLLQYRANKEARDKYGHTPLHHAVRHNSLEAMLLLLEQRADIEAKNNYDRRPLHEAASYNASWSIHCLALLGANIEAKDNKQRTPLHLAFREKSKEAICALRSAKANFSAEDIKGDTPKDVSDKHCNYQKSKKREIKETRKNRIREYAASENKSVQQGMSKEQNQSREFPPLKPSHDADLLTVNPTRKPFIGEDTSNRSHLNFSTWYHPDVCHCLLQMVENRAQCLRVIFHDLANDNNTTAFKSQLQTLIVLTNRLNKPAVFISKEPGANNHFICGLLKANNLLLINPLGITNHMSVYQTLGELQKDHTIVNAWLSSTVSQRKEYEERLVSCGPISLEIALHILGDFKLEQLNQFWSNLKTNEVITHEASQLKFFGIPIGTLLSEDLQKLATLNDETTYRQHVIAIRQRHGEMLKTLAAYRAKEANVTIENCLAAYKESSYGQVVFNALLTQHRTAVNMDGLPEYQLLAKALDTPEEQIASEKNEQQIPIVVSPQQSTLIQLNGHSPENLNIFNINGEQGNKILLKESNANKNGNKNNDKPMLGSTAQQHLIKQARLINREAINFYRKQDYVNAINKCHRAWYLIDFINRVTDSLSQEYNLELASVYYNLGSAFMKIGKYTMAIRYLYRALAIKTKYGDNYENTSKVLKRLEEAKKAKLAALQQTIMAQAQPPAQPATLEGYQQHGLFAPSASPAAASAYPHTDHNPATTTPVPH
jgi:ankyrin repeat protein